MVGSTGSFLVLFCATTSCLRRRTISEKLSEMFVQYDSRGHGATSYAWATLSFSEAAVPSHRATLKVYIQIPSAENLLKTSEERAKEATETL